ncbi:MAG: hypothetical protein LBI36_07690 [Oscillospiraceae bacterium]|jgi:hypothetical protein|nr:hypothetical protein [Oscillospiraceae bacterium]
MGLFNSFLKEASKALTNMAQNANSNTSRPAGANQSAGASRPAKQSGGAVNAAKTAEAKAYFAQILASEFSQYQVREGVSVSELGGEGRPYDFGLYQDGRLVAVVVLAEHNRTRNKPYWNSEIKARELHIPFINFYIHMPNERDFVIGRIKRLMGTT